MPTATPHLLLSTPSAPAALLGTPFSIPAFPSAPWSGREHVAHGAISRLGRERAAPGNGHIQGRRVPFFHGHVLYARTHMSSP